MTYNQLITNILNKVGHPGGSELISKSDVILYINNGLAYIEGVNTWYFSKLTKTITPGGTATVFTLPTELHKAFTVKGITGTTEVALTESNTSYGYVVTWGVITTTEAYESVVISGAWGLADLGNTTDELNAAIPMPKMLVSALYFFVLAQTIEVYLETGYSMTEYYYGLAKNFCENASKKYSLTEVRELSPRR